MHWPRRPVEEIPHHQFRPPHCPWLECAQHVIPDGDRFRYKRSGFFTREGDGRRVQRFVCHECGRSCSQQTFSCSYYAKLPRGTLIGVAAGLVAGSAHRQIARSLGCAPSTVTRIAAKLGRHTLLLQARSLQHLGGIHEPVAVDHFETFVVSQLDALGVATPVGHASWFVYAADPAPHRRGGRLTPAQKRKLEKRTRPLPPKGGVVRSFSRMLDVLESVLGPEGPLVLLTDGHPAYPISIRRHPLGPRIRHRAFANPKRGPKGSPRGPQAKARDDALFPVDTLHALIRHSGAHNRRETIAFSRRINATMERMYLLLVWRNFVKGRSERRPDRSTAAMRLGLTQEPWSWSRVLARRLFPGRVRLPESWKKIYLRDWDEAEDLQYRRHRLKNAA
jgi:transposase-like protein